MSHIVVVLLLSFELLIQTPEVFHMWPVRNKKLCDISSDAASHQQLRGAESMHTMALVLPYNSVEPCKGLGSAPEGLSPSSPLSRPVHWLEDSEGYW